MLCKHYSLGSVFEETGEARVKLANFDDLKSQGEDIASFLNTFKPDPGFVYLHVIAMGAGEYYGCNINGDYFPERDLINRHNTFVTNAKVFKEHDNKPYSPDYGHVAFSWYNPKMHRVELILAVDKVKGKEFIERQARGEQLEVSMGCFPAGTRVSINNVDTLDIENINPGMSVLTHAGNIKTVKTKMLHYFTGNMHTFTIAGQTRKLTATENHPILVRRYTKFPTQGEGICPVCGKHVKQVLTHIIRSKDQDHVNFYADLEASKYSYVESWVRADQIELGDYVVNPVHAENLHQPLVSDSLARICGFFLAEGSFVKYKGKYTAVQFNFAGTETDLHKTVLADLNELSLVTPSYQIRKDKNVGCISIYDSTLANRIYQLCGEYSKHKKLSQEIFEWPLSAKLKLLGAYIDGDGTWNKLNKVASCTTISKDLAYGVQKLAALCNLTASISEYMGKHNQTYLVSFAKSDTAELSKVAAKIPNEVYERKLIKLPVVFNDNGKLIKRVQGISIESVQDLPVYNLSVEDDESFVTENIAVHNCKVAYDVCSICGNKAKRRDEYCAHIRHDKKKIYPDGKQPYMINYNPTFFDISIVKRRADRIAYVLDKVASVNSGDSTISYHKYNEFENLDQSVIPFAPDPERAVFDWEDEPVEKAAGIHEPTLGEKIAMIKRINSDAVRVLNKGIMKSLPALEAEEPDLPPAMLDRIAAKYSIPDILKSFIMSAIPLKPREFTRIIIVNQGLPLESYDSVLRGVLRAKATELPAASSQNEITSLLEPFLTSRSSFLPAILARIEKLLQRKEKTAGIKLDPMSSYYGLNPNITFGHISQQPAYNTIEATVPNRAYVIQKNPMASMPIVVSPEAYARSLNRPKLRLPDLDPEKTGLILGGMYLASRAMPNIAEIMKQYPELPIAAAIASLYYAKSKMDEPDVMQKKAMIIQPTPELVGKYALPFVATHLASAHLRGVHENGGKLSDTEKFIAEHPDILSILAPLAIGLALKKHANVKLASSRSLNYQADASDEKVAYLADVLADAAML